jgi:hypothetical protein
VNEEGALIVGRGAEDSEEVTLEANIWTPVLFGESGEIRLSSASGLSTPYIEVSDALIFSPFSMSEERIANLAATRVLVDPLFYLATPCVFPPEIAGGVFSEVEYAISNPNIRDLGQLPTLDIGLKYLSEMEVFKVACPPPVSEQDRFWNVNACLYSVEKRP